MAREYEQCEPLRQWVGQLSQFLVLYVRYCQGLKLRRAYFPSVAAACTSIIFEVAQFDRGAHCIFNASL